MYEIFYVIFLYPALLKWLLGNRNSTYMIGGLIAFHLFFLSIFPTNNLILTLKLSKRNQNLRNGPLQYKELFTFSATWFAFIEEKL